MQMEPTIRQYQRDAVNSVVEAVKDGAKKILFIMVTGSGKMRVISEIMSTLVETLQNQRPTRLLFVCDRQDIAFTALQQFKTNNLTASLGEDKSAEVNIITAQKITQSQNSTSAINSNNYNFIFVFGTEWLGLDRPDSALRVFLDEYSKGSIIGIDSILDKSIEYFGQPVYQYTLAKAIDDGTLVGYRWLTIKVEAETTIDRLKEIAKELISHGHNTKTIVYCKDQSEAFELVKVLNGITGDADYSDAITSSAINRNEIIDRFRNSVDPVVLTTVDVLSGVDLPNIQNIAFTRLIQSQRYLSQILTKGLLPFTGKEALNVFDFVGQDKLPTDVPPLYQNILETRKVTSRGKSLHDRVSFKNDRIALKDKHLVNGVLGVKELALEIATIVSNFPLELGHLVGILGKWGRGKTFLMNEVWNALKGDGFKRIDFHAWKYQDAPPIWAYLFEQFSSKYYADAKNEATRVWRRFFLNAIRLGTRPLILFGISLAIYTALYFLFDFHEKINFFKSLLGAVGISFLIYLVIIYFKYGESAKSLYDRYFERKDFTHLMGIQAELQNELKCLLKAWARLDENLRICLFVDDIDRCSEKKIIEIIDALRIMLEDEEISNHVVIIAAIDERILKRAIKLKYAELVKIETRNDEDFQLELDRITREYIDKLFILGIKLGDLSIEERLDFFKEFTRNHFEKNDQRPEVYSELRDKENTSTIEDAFFVPSIEEPVSLANEAEAKGADPRNEPTRRSNEFKLSSTEFDLLNDGLSNFHLATPRQIRIFYYRYLILKNILARVYSKTSVSYWSEPANAKILINILVKYSVGNQVISISSHKETVFQSKDAFIKVILTEDSYVPKADYLKLLGALDMVVAY